MSKSAYATVASLVVTAFLSGRACQSEKDTDRMIDFAAGERTAKENLDTAKLDLGTCTQRRTWCADALSAVRVQNEMDKYSSGSGWSQVASTGKKKKRAMGGPKH